MSPSPAGRPAVEAPVVEGRAARSPVPCPSCGSPLPPDVLSCPRCALPLHGPVARELWQVDQEISALNARHAVLLHRLRGEIAGSPGVGWTTTGQPLAPGTGVAGPGGAGGRPDAPRATVQQVLLVVGVVLLTVAAVVFIGAVWVRLGVAGQSAVLLGVTGVTAAAARACAVRGLRASAEALAVLAVLLLVVTLRGARELDLFGARSIDGAAWTAAVATVVGLAALGADRWLRPRQARGPLAYPAAALAAAVVVPSAVVDAADGGALAWSTTAVGVATAGTCGALAVARRPAADRRTRGLRWAVAGLSGAHLGAGLVVLAGLVVGGQSAADAAWTAVLLAVVALVSVALHRHSRQRSLPLAEPAHALGWAAAGGSLLAASAGIGGTALVVTAIVLAVAGAVLAGARLGRPSLRGPRHLVTALLATAAAAATLASVSVPGEDVAPVLRGVAWAAVGLGAIVPAVRRPTERSGWVLLAAGGLLLAGVAGGAELAARPATALLSGLALGLVTAAILRRHHPEELVLAFAAGTGFTLAVAITLELAPEDAPLLSAHLGAAGIAALAYAGVPGRGWVSVAAVLLLSSATWVLAADAQLEDVEPYSLPLAGLALGVGLVRLRRQPDSPSWLTVGPGLTAALLPSALAAVDDPGLARPLLTLAAAVAVIAVGVVLSWQAPVATGAVAAAIVAVSQLAPWAVGLPRWLSLGVAGLLLVALGIRFEQRRRNLQVAVAWVRRLS